MIMQELLEAAAKRNFDLVKSLIKSTNFTSDKMKIQIKDSVEFHFDEGMPWTKLHRDYCFMHDNQSLLEWWEEYYGQYGSG